MLPRPYKWNATQNADVFISLEFDKGARHVESRPTQFSDFRNSKNVILRKNNYIDGGGDSLTVSYLICSLFTGT